MTRRRQNSTFSLSFLDIMSCGLGAAVLLFLIIKHQSDTTIEESLDLSAETQLLEEEILIGQENLARIKNTLSDIDDQLAEAQGQARRIQEEIDTLLNQLDDIDPKDVQTTEELKERIAKLEKQKSTLEQQSRAGNRAREFAGVGDRQYLTGLKLGGERVLILLDSSASMLDETIINIIRRRNRSDEVKKASAKWQQAIAIVDWIVANLDPGSNVQLYTFNEQATSTHPEQSGKWINTSEDDEVDILIENMRNVVPENGTSLHNAIAVINNMNPRPDNVYLITDGLPTLSDEPATSTAVSGRDRLGFFNSAFRTVPQSIPINTLLLPMEGDLLAAAAYWRLAIATNGSFIAPPRDWP